MIPTTDPERLAEFCRQYDLDLVVLFGSRARGAATAASDYDIAVLPSGRPIRPEIVLQLTYDLSRVLGVVEIDLVDLRRASPLLKQQVAESGRVLFESDTATFKRFRVLAFKMFQDAQYDLYRFLPRSIERGLEKLNS